jgi:hypothetical protein
MKFITSKLLILLSIALLLSVFYSCEKEETDKLDVRFQNEAASEYTITRLEIRQRGSVNKNQLPTDSWSENLLKNGISLAPGNQINLTLSIPEGHWAEYRVWVDNDGTELMLYDQPNYSGFRDLPITHWGSDSRYVSVIIKYNISNDQIEVVGWTDNTWDY